jgi:hypothetical protein
VDDYVKIACSLIDDKPRREVLRAALIAKSHALFDDPAPIAALSRWILKNVNQQN